MQRRLTIRSAAGALLLVTALALPTFAKDPMPGEHPGPGMDRGTNQGMMNPAKSLYFASSFMDASFDGSNQFDQVEDLVVDPSGPRILYVVCSKKGEDRYVAVPIDRCELAYDTKDDLTLTLRVSGDIGQFPTFTEDKWDDGDQWNSISDELRQKPGASDRGMKDEGMRGGMDHGNMPGGMHRGGTSGRNDGTGENEKNEGSEKNGSGATPAARSGDHVSTGRLYRFSKLNGLDVDNSKGEDIGDVDDLLFEANTGRVRQVIVTAEGFLGVATARHSIPCDQIRFGTDHATLTGMAGGGMARTAGERGSENEYPGRETAKTGEDEGQALRLNLRPGQQITYRVEADPGQVEVAGWESERDSNRTSPETEPHRARWTGTYSIRVQGPTGNSGLGTEQGHRLEVSVRSGEGREEVASYDVKLSPNGSIRSIEPARTSNRETGNDEGTNRVPNPAATSSTIRTHLMLICAGDLRGRRLDKNTEVSLPNVASRSQNLKLEFDESASNDRRASFDIVNDDGDRVGTAAYDRDTGLLRSFRLQPKSGEQEALVIRQQSGSMSENGMRSGSEDEGGSDRDR